MSSTKSVFKIQRGDIWTYIIKTQATYKNPETIYQNNVKKNSSPMSYYLYYKYWYRLPVNRYLVNILWIPLRERIILSYYLEARQRLRQDWGYRSDFEIKVSTYFGGS